MDEKIREQIAMFRYSVIGPLVCGELVHGELKKRIRELALRRFLIPYSRRHSVGFGTIEDWLGAYREHGIEGLKPKTRSDVGKNRQLDDKTVQAIMDYRSQHPRVPLRLVVDTLIKGTQIPPQQIPLSTLYRFLRIHMPHRTIPVTGKEQKRFCHRFPNDCWQSDVMHGPYIKEKGDAAKKTYLVAILDDATRLIVGAQFFYSEAVVNIKQVFKAAVLTYGVPDKLYLDNGRNFCADDLELACATMRCALIHSTAYYPEGKGKIERFFRTVRDCCLSIMPQVHNLLDLNTYFAEWVQQQYNRAVHSSLENVSPLDCFLSKAENRIRRLPAHIDPNDLFCRKQQRLVSKDGTFRINNVLYETEEQLIGRKIDVLYDVDDSTKKVKVFDNSVFIHIAKPIDFISNAHARRKDIDKQQGQQL